MKKPKRRKEDPEKSSLRHKEYRKKNKARNLELYKKRQVEAVKLLNKGLISIAEYERRLHDLHDVKKKVCPKCKEEKDAMEFARDITSKDALYNICKYHMSLQHKKYIRKNKEKILRRMKEYYKKNWKRITAHNRSRYRQMAKKRLKKQGGRIDFGNVPRDDPVVQELEAGAIFGVGGRVGNYIYKMTRYKKLIRIPYKVPSYMRTFGIFKMQRPLSELSKWWYFKLNENQRARWKGYLTYDLPKKNGIHKHPHDIIKESDNVMSPMDAFLEANLWLESVHFDRVINAPIAYKPEFALIENAEVNIISISEHGMPYKGGIPYGLLEQWRDVVPVRLFELAVRLNIDIPEDTTSYKRRLRIVIQPGYLKRKRGERIWYWTRRPRIQEVLSIERKPQKLIYEFGKYRDYTIGDKEYYPLYPGTWWIQCDIVRSDGRKSIASNISRIKIFPDGRWYIKENW